MPSPGYLAEKLEQVENNAPKATPLDEVVSVAESDKYTTSHTTDLAAFYRAVNKKVKGMQDFNLKYLPTLNIA